MIFISAPYTFTEGTPEANKIVEGRRYRDTLDLCAQLRERGLHPISSVVHWHDIARIYGFPKDASFWEEYNEQLLLRCDRMLVYKMPGWKTSSGVTIELKIARKEGIPVEKELPSDELIRNHQNTIYEAKSSVQNARD